MTICLMIQKARKGGKCSQGDHRTGRTVSCVCMLSGPNAVYGESVSVITSCNPKTGLCLD